MVLRREALRRVVSLREVLLPAALFLLRADLFLASALSFAFLFLVRAAFLAAALRAALDLAIFSCDYC